MRAAQIGVAAFFFAGEQLFGKLGRQPPALLGQMHENKMLTAGAIYGLDVIAQTMKAPAPRRTLSARASPRTRARASASKRV